MMKKILVSFVISVSAFAGEYDHRPYLHLGGQQLAKQVASQICHDERVTNFSNYHHLSLIKAGKSGSYGEELPVRNSEKRKAKLLTWILSKPDNSIKPDKLTVAAVEICQGNVLCGLRLVYNLLAQDWGDKSTFTKRPVFQKLVDITGEKEIVIAASKNKLKYGHTWSTRGGKASSWYHIFGVAAITYDEGTKHYDERSLNRELNAILARSLANLVVIPLLAAEHAIDKETQDTKKYSDAHKRHLYNLEGKYFGAALASELIRLKHGKSCTSLQVKRRDYLSDRPELYGRQYPLKKGVHPRDHIPQFATINESVGRAHATVIKKLRELLEI